ncbi:UNVERIFIED_CONTAM: hypothetical protein RMT77_013912 [Armadillidium vulgare]
MKCGVAFCVFLSLFGLSYGFVSSLTPPSDNNEIDEASAREEIERNRLSLSDLQDRFTLNIPRPFSQMSVFNRPFTPFFTINVKPNPCNTTSGRQGHCYTRRECSTRGGLPDGNCARGIGVCCMLENRCGAVIKTNNSILVNDNYPTDVTDIGNCQYVIEKIHPNICQLRLEFEKFSLLGPNAENSLCEQDTFTIVGAAGDNPQVICGENAGQHMYIDLPSGYGSSRINIATSTTGPRRSWRIKAQQIECNSPYRAPQNCLQYFTSYSNIISSFNFKRNNESNHIGGLSYSVCVKSGEGYCGITYQSINFSVSDDGTDRTPEILTSEDDCDKDFISIFTQDKNGVITTDRYCGTGVLHTSTFAKPFILRVITNTEEEEDNDNNNGGFQIRYTQVPC